MRRVGSLPGLGRRGDGDSASPGGLSLSLRKGMVEMVRRQPAEKVELLWGVWRVGTTKGKALISRVTQYLTLLSIPYPVGIAICNLLAKAKTGLVVNCEREIGMARRALARVLYVSHPSYIRRATLIFRMGLLF